MGQNEVLHYLELLRMSGDHNYYRYEEIHKAMRRDGVSLCYGSVYRSLNQLFTHHEIEAQFIGGILQRTIKFRSKEPGYVRVSHIKEQGKPEHVRVSEESTTHDMSGELNQNSPSAAPEATTRPTPDVAARHSGG